MDTLGDKQRRFAKQFAAWIAWVYREGFAVTFGEAYRTPEQAAHNAANGTGIANSLHTQRLAVDVNLFKKDALGNWQWLSKGTEPEWLYVGQHWESYSADTAWGGRFGDANHLSISHEGRK